MKVEAPVDVMFKASDEEYRKKPLFKIEKISKFNAFLIKVL